VGVIYDIEKLISMKLTDHVAHHMIAIVFNLKIHTTMRVKITMLDRTTFAFSCPSSKVGVEERS